MGMEVAMTEQAGFRVTILELESDEEGTPICANLS